MPFSKSRVNGRSVFTETVALANATTANGSTMSFVPSGVGFTAIVNTGAVNTVGAVSVDLEGSIDGTNWSTIDGSFLGDIDTATLTKVYVAATSGDWPYYRLTYDCVGNDSPTSIVVAVVPTES